MLLAVAGLDQDTLTKRTKLLASGDWSTLPPEERFGYFFAKKQGREPWTISDEDMRGLVAQFGEVRALDVLWWACRCHYMTRVADAFQIPLERENVFQNPAAKVPRPVRDRRE